ncbi:CBL-interacting serine/threonine-protein kinase 21-like isoform X2 [Rhododendron vialii]|uniref:CBL-interacting serine/threonine-protein kinase 21-like isoform X2 n=1 Tax=Rhododendron vialii TaxID=182163 RepID=UPI002660322C|nr:CBL-interacting serine/threonine-protein kinase 21-like isoform X2 [Rhododendron vialii]
MGYTNSIGKYQLIRTIGEGMFAKVKLAVNTDNGQYVAIKIIDKQMVVKRNLMYQVKREIRTMKLLNHPNIVKIHEVIGTKTKIYMVMDYVPGGQLSDKMLYVKRFDERKARKHFQLLIDAVDYCHSRGVYHRDLKPENLLLDRNENLKVSDFGLSVLRKPGDLLSTACGSPSYVAPELITNKGYEGAAVDIWSCGVILFELLAGFLPFDDRSLVNLYLKILRAEYVFPEWFTESHKKLISRILDPNPRTRITLQEIIEDKWFQTDYEPAVHFECDEDTNLDDVHASLGSIEENETQTKPSNTPSFINAFQLIAMSQDLDLSGLFEVQKITLGSKHTIHKTIEKIEAAARDVSLSVERKNNSKLKIHPELKMSRSFFNLSAEVIEVAPTHCVIEISKSDGELGLYREFCKSLSSMLTEESGVSTENQAAKEVIVNSKNMYQTEGSLGSVEIL